MFTSGVYLIKNSKNGKQYVGSTRFLERRWEQHRRELRNGRHFNRHLQGSWDEHGEESFGYQVLEHCQPEELTAREAWWITHFGSNEPVKGYNLGACVAGVCSDETRARIAASQKGRPRPDLIGRKQTPEEKANQIAAQKGKSGLWNKGRKHTEEHKAKVAAARRGYKHSEETKEKIGAAHRGKPRSPESIQKSANSKRGSKHTEEAKLKISAGLRAFHERRSQEQN